MSRDKDYSNSLLMEIEAEPYDPYKALAKRLCCLDLDIILAEPPSCFEDGCVETCKKIGKCREKQFQHLKRAIADKYSFTRELYCFCDGYYILNLVEKACKFESLKAFREAYKDKEVYFKLGEKYVAQNTFSKDYFIRKKEEENEPKKQEENTKAKKGRHSYIPRAVKGICYILEDTNHKEIARSVFLTDFKKYKVPIVDLTHGKLLFDCMKNPGKKRDFYIRIEKTDDI